MIRILNSKFSLQERSCHCKIRRMLLPGETTTELQSTIPSLPPQSNNANFIFTEKTFLALLIIIYLILLQMEDFIVTWNIFGQTTNFRMYSLTKVKSVIEVKYLSLDTYKSFHSFDTRYLQKLSWIQIFVGVFWFVYYFTNAISSIASNGWKIQPIQDCM